MKIVSIAENNNEIFEEVLEEDVLEEDLNDIDLDSEPFLNIDDLRFTYIDPKNGLTTSGPLEIEANDGTKMIFGVLKIENRISPEEIEKMVEKGLLDRALSFANQDARVNIQKDNLITDKLYDGELSFLVSSAQYNKVSNSSLDNLKIAKKINEENVQKVYECFFERFNLDDIVYFDINSANDYLFETLEKVAVNLTKIEKLEVKNRIRRELKKHDISLACIG
jgi:hypothetical protein